ncbi:MAG: hypothetical protein J5527_12875 [Treponema sp.]|nr:hypothetical protein [Treponema sp.]
MKKTVSKILSLSFVLCTVVFSTPLSAQVKTTFTKETRPADYKPTGMVASEGQGTQNKVDVQMPAKTRGIERYQKKNVFGQDIPDSFLFYRSVLNERQKVAYDIVYKCVMNAQHEVELTVKTSVDEFAQVINAVRYDNPEAIWWSGYYTYWTNSDNVVTKVDPVYWVEDSQIEKAYNDFWSMTVPIIFYASRLSDEMSKIKYIHDYICLSTEYDHEAADSNNCGGKYQTAYSCAVEYKTVCAGYSACFQYYMQQLGIPCASMWGSGHQWNFIQVDGHYYQMDVTWDDTMIVPCYYNLMHADMQKIDSHTPDPLAKNVIKKYPSKTNKMTYLKYFGPLVEGSPYTYAELGNFEEEVNNPEKAKVYEDTPQILPIISNKNDFEQLVKYGFNSTGNSTVDFFFFIPNEKKVDYVVNPITDGTVGNWLYSLGKSGTYSYGYNSTTIDGSLVMNLTLEAN